MRIVAQRSKKASVTVENKVVGEISKGLVLLVCLEKGDTEETLLKSAEKIKNLRCFTCPETGKMNLNLKQTGGEVLAVSQFTLSWRGQKGNRPSFDNSMAPEMANEMFEKFVSELKKSFRVETGVFGASMEVALVNDGPVTFSLDF